MDTDEQRVAATHGRRSRGLESVDSEGEKKSYKRKHNLLSRSNSGEDDAEKVTGPGKNVSPERKNESADHIDEKARMLSELERGLPVKAAMKVASYEDRRKYRAMMAKLRQEMTTLTDKVHSRATKCMHLTDENKKIMDELRQMCDQQTIEILEARNPDKNPQADESSGATEVQEH